MAQPLTDAINALTRYANETTGASDTTLSDAVETLVEGYGEGGEDKWVRPAEWANFDLLSKDDHAVYMTIDNRVQPTTLGVYGWGYYYLQRVRINNDGTVDVLESSASSRGGLTISIPAEAGDYPVYRVKAVDAELTEFSLEGDKFRWYKVLERWVNLPNAIYLGVGYSYRNFQNSIVKAETFMDFSSNCNALNLSYENCLKSLRNFSGKALPVSNYRMDVQLQHIEGEFVYSGGTNLSYCLNWCCNLKEISIATANVVNITTLAATFERCLNAKKISLPIIDYSSLTSMNSMCGFCHSLESFVFPEGDYSKVTNIEGIFRECYALSEPIILPKTLTCTIGNNAFAQCLNLPCVVILSETMMPLVNVNAFYLLYDYRYDFRIYVRQSLITEYQQAANWSTIYGKNADFFQPIEGSEFEYLLEGE